MDSFRQSLRLSQTAGSDVVASDHNSFRRHEQTFDGGEVNFWQLPNDQDEAAAQSSSCAPRNARHGCACSWSISKPLVVVVVGTLGPLITLLTIISCHRFAPTESMFEAGKHTSEGGVLFVKYSATILTNISSISSTIAPFLVAMVMALWSPYLSKCLIEASREASGENSQNELPRPVHFSLLVNMMAGHPDQLWKYFCTSMKTFRNQTYARSPPVVRGTAWVLFLSVFLVILTFAGDQFFHIWTEAVLLDHYNIPDDLNSFGRGLCSLCLSLSRADPDELGWPCTHAMNQFISDQEYSSREREVGALFANSSDTSQIMFHPELSDDNTDLAVLYPAPATAPLNVDYRANTLAVATRCQVITPKCILISISDILTQFNCTPTFYGVLGKPPNITTDMNDKPYDSDVPGLAWKISAALEYSFFSDPGLTVPYNTFGLNPETGNGDPDLPVMPDSQLVNPVYLAVAGRFPDADTVAGSGLVRSSTSARNGTQNPLFRQSYGGMAWDFILNCSYTTYEVTYTVVNSTTLFSSPTDFVVSRTPNGSIAEMWHGRQEFTSLDGDPSGDLVESNLVAAKQSSSGEFTRTWANLYSLRVLSVVGGYSSPRINLLEQRHESVLVTRIPLWTLGFLLGTNFTYAILGFVVAAIACTVATKEVLQVSREIDLNRQVEERYGEPELADRQGGGGRSSKGGDESWEMQGLSAGGLRVGVIDGRFEPIYFAK